MSHAVETSETVGRRAWFDALLIGLFAAVLGAIGGGRPSFWYDEVATVHSATRTPGRLAALLANQDAVHGFYYALMHGWFGLFGVSTTAARLPSALAVGVAAAGVVVLGRQLADRHFALVAGLVFAVLPQVTWAAVEARSSATTLAVAVWLTVLLCVADRARPGRRVLAWAAYGIGVVIAVLTLVFMAALIAVHAIVLVQQRVSKRTWVGWGSATAAALVVSVPFVRLVAGQSGQVAWIPAFGSRIVGAVALDQWFDGSWWFALGALVLVAAGAVLRRRPMPGVLPLAIVWMVVPTAALILYSAVASPMYVPRYLAFTLPAVALLIAWGICQLSTRTGVVALCVAVLAALSVPTWLAQRGPDAKPSSMDFSEVNRFAAEHVKPGDCVLFGSAVWNPASQRLVDYADPSSFDGVRDIGLGGDGIANGWLWDGDLPGDEALAAAPSCDRLWYFTDQERDHTEIVRHSSNEVWTLEPYAFEQDPRAAQFTDAGLTVVDRWQFARSQVVLLER